MRNKKWVLFLLVLGIFSSLPSTACNYSSLMRSFNRAVQRWAASPTQARADRICRIIARIENKFTNSPGTPTPMPPAGVTCTPMPTIGSGRGGGPGGIMVGIGNGATTHGWVRNSGDQACTYDWEVIPDPLNPPGFDVFPLSGSLLVPPATSMAAPFDVMIDPTVPPLTLAFFDIFWVNQCSGLPLAADSSRFQVFADPELTVLPADPFLLAPPGFGLDVFFAITNHTASPVTRTFDFIHIGDPASVMEFNNGGLFDVVNLFPLDKSVNSVGVTIDPFSTEIVHKETLLPGEICDPAMINCCGLAFGDGVCCAMIFNDDLGPRQISHLPVELVGNPTGVGNIGYQVGPFQVQIPTDLAPTPPELLDLLGQQTLNMALNLNDFNFMPFVMEADFLLMSPLQFPPLFFSNDPGLLWQPTPPPLLPLLPAWNLQPDLMLQALVPQVNGWLPPPPLE